MDDSEVIDALTDLSKRIFCHGTTSKALEGMKRCGITPRGTNGCKASIWEGALESKHGRAYVGDLHRVSPTRRHKRVNRKSWTSIEGRQTSGMFGGAICLGSAEQAAKVVGGEPIVLEVKGSALDKSRLLPDEDMEKAFATPISDGWLNYMENRKLNRDVYVRKGYKLTAEEKAMSQAMHTCEWVLAGAMDYKKDMIRKVRDVLGYDAHPGLWNIHSDTNVPSLGREDLQLLKRLRRQPRGEAKRQIRRICKALPPWYHSLLTNGTVAMEASIPESAISVRYAEPPKELKEKMLDDFLQESKRRFEQQQASSIFSERPTFLDQFVDAKGVPLSRWHRRKQRYILKR